MTNNGFATITQTGSKLPKSWLIGKKGFALLQETKYNRD